MNTKFETMIKRISGHFLPLVAYFPKENKLFPCMSLPLYVCICKKPLYVRMWEKMYKICKESAKFSFFSFFFFWYLSCVEKFFIVKYFKHKFFNS